MTALTVESSGTATITEISRSAIDQGNASRLAVVSSLPGSGVGVESVAISPDSRLLAAGRSTGQVEIYGIPDGSLLTTLTAHSGSVNSVAFSPDGLLLASGSDDRHVRLWTANNFSLERDISTSLEGRVLKVRFSPTDSQVAIGGHLCVVSLRSQETGILRRTFIQPGCNPRYGGSVDFWGMEFFESGGELITGDGQPSGSGGSIQMWDINSYVEPDLVKGYDLVVRDISIHPDGGIVAVGLVGSNEIWELALADGSVVRTYQGPLFRVNTLAYFPSGYLLAAGSRDGVVYIWDVSSGEPLAELGDLQSPVNSLAISPDGALIAAGSEDGQVMLWGLVE